MLRRLFKAAPPSRSDEPASFEVVVRGRPVEIAVRRHAAARRITLRVKNATGQLVLTLPSRANLSTARGFAERQVDWIAARLDRFPETVPFVPGADIPLRGVPHRLAHRGLRGVTRIEPGLRGEPPIIAIFGPPDHFTRRVTDFLIREAKKDLAPAVARHAAALGVATGRISVKDTVSRWGSCSSKGSLAFSWRLIMAPPFVLDYLAAHEVAHRREMNHGDGFWTLVYRLCPATDQAEAWLKANGPGLHRYGAQSKGP